MRDVHRCSGYCTHTHTHTYKDTHAWSVWLEVKKQWTQKLFLGHSATLNWNELQSIHLFCGLVSSIELWQCTINQNWGSWLQWRRKRGGSSEGWSPHNFGTQQSNKVISLRYTFKPQQTCPWSTSPPPPPPPPPPLPLIFPSSYTAGLHVEEGKEGGGGREAVIGSQAQSTNESHFIPSCLSWWNSVSIYKRISSQRSAPCIAMATHQYMSGVLPLSSGMSTSCPWSSRDCTRRKLPSLHTHTHTYKHNAPRWDAGTKK